MSSSLHPLISIITVTRNDLKALRETVESVKRFAPATSEYIVIDGASTDGTLQYLETMETAIDRWISESDAGIYNAMNKGTRLAHGDFCLYLNAGDRLLESAAAIQFNDDGHDVYYWDALLSDNGHLQEIPYPDTVDANYFISGMINHQNTVIRRKTLLRMGGFDESFRISADWLFFLKAALANERAFKRIGSAICAFEVGGISSAPGSGRLIDEERRRGIDSCFGRLSPTIHELVEFRQSLYGNIRNLGGDGSVLGFILRCYRFIWRRWRRILMYIRNVMRFKR